MVVFGLTNLFLVFRDLNDIGNVFINNVQNDQVLKWDSTNNRWTNATDAGGTQINTINDIGNVSDTNTQNGQLLKYNSSAGRWENFTPTYISSFTETDPIFSASAASGITSTLINNWNTAHGWGNHVAQGYLLLFLLTYRLMRCCVGMELVGLMNQPLNT